MTINRRTLEVMLRSLTELSELTSLDEAQQALLGDVRRALGIVTKIPMTLTTGCVTRLPITSADGRTTWHERGQA